MGMVDPSDIAGDVIAGATALAGLILVYLGSLGSSGASASAASSLRDQDRLQASERAAREHGLKAIEALRAPKWDERRR
jgi:hypothetical protein